MQILPQLPSPPWQKQKCTRLVNENMPVRHRPEEPFSIYKSPCSPIAEAPVSDTGGCGCKSCHGYQFWSFNQTSVLASFAKRQVPGNRNGVQVLGAPPILLPDAHVAQQQRRRVESSEVAGANPVVGTNSSVAEREMHSSRKGDHVGATPARGTISKSFVAETAMHSPGTGEDAGATPAEGTIFACPRSVVVNTPGFLPGTVGSTPAGDAKFQVRWNAPSKRRCSAVA